MRRILVPVLVAGTLLSAPSTALATTPPDDPNDVEAVDNPLDENDDEGFDDSGLLGLVGLLGLLGLAGRRRYDRVEVRTDDRYRT